MPLIEPSIPAMLEDRAQQQPDDIAYTFIDYEVDPAGLAESLTWSQVHQRTQVVAEKLSKCGSPGDRAVILAPQSLEYVIAFLGAIQAGFVAVPLSVPQFGQHDERVSGALRDCTPVAVLTTSTVVDDIRKYGQADPRQRAPRVIEVDTLDFDSPRQARDGFASADGVSAVHLRIDPSAGRCGGDAQERGDQPGPAAARLLRGLRRRRTSGHHDRVVAALLPRHGTDRRGVHPDDARTPGGADEPGGVHAEAGPVDAAAGDPTPARSPLRPNFAFELAVRRTSDDDLAGHGSGRRRGHDQRRRTGARRDGAPLQRAVRSVQPARHRDAAVLRTCRGDGVCGVVRRGTSADDGAFRLREVGRRARRALRRRERFGAGRLRRAPVDDGARGRSRDSDREACRQDRRGLAARRPCGGGYWRNPQLRASCSADSWASRRRAPRRDRGCVPAIWA